MTTTDYRTGRTGDASLMFFDWREIENGPVKNPTAMSQRQFPSETMSSFRKFKYKNETGIEYQEHIFFALEKAAELRDYRAVEFLARNIDYSSYGPFNMKRAIDLALMLDMVPLACELAQKGLCLYPKEKAFQQAAVVLAPPQIIGTHPSQPANLPASQEWLKNNAAEYKGKWVAVGDGKLLGAASTLKELREPIEDFRKSKGTMIIVKVLS